MTGQVSRSRGLAPHGEMGVIGYVIGAGVVIALLPILPFIAVLWLVVKLFGNESGRPAAR